MGNNTGRKIVILTNIFVAIWSLGIMLWFTSRDIIFMSMIVLTICLLGAALYGLSVIVRCHERSVQLLEELTKKITEDKKEQEENAS